MMNAEILRDAEQRRFAWRCRRGLLELDIVLQNFVLNHYEALTLDELQVFDGLLALPDNEFWALLNDPSIDSTSVENTSKAVKATSAKEKARNAMICKIKTGRFNKAEEAK